ncbi:uncharacterized protein LOC128884426 isoform X2 [Hylaeus volcanicus]|uniref:uncharacterized protein LOC128884426 isoform X2 n=1 Tax=Hylaeus volcanicus TaxID=313075 RepID=UPI0023B7CC64|nr:uncharacterized protein LOC128884426 isoform X2 [Hylaeus volcanicus]
MLIRKKKKKIPQFLFLVYKKTFDFFFNGKSAVKNIGFCLVRLYTKTKFLCETYKELRWAVQVGVGAGFSSFFLIFLTPSQLFFDATAGGSFKRAWLNLTFYTLGAFAGYSFSLLSILCHKMIGKSVVPFITFVSVLLIVIPGGFIRFNFPSTIVAVNVGLSTAELILLAGFNEVMDYNLQKEALKRVISCCVGSLCSLLASQYVLCYRARPNVLKSLEKILLVMSDILKPLQPMHSYSSSVPAHILCASKLVSCSRNTIPSALHKDTSSADKLNNVSRIHFKYDANEFKKYCAKMIENVNTCQELLASQNLLIECAKQELSCQKPYRFPEVKYKALLNEIRTLFFHISSLVFHMNLYVTDNYKTRQSLKCGVWETREEETNDLCSFEEKDRVKSVEDWKMVNGKHFTKDFRNLKRMEEKSNEDLEANERNMECSNVIEIPQMYEASEKTHLIGTLQKIEEDVFDTITFHISEALRHLATSLRTKDGSRELALRELKVTEKVFNKIQTYRISQRESFSNIIMNTFACDQSKRWSTTTLEAIQTKWFDALDVDLQTYVSFTDKENTLFWDAYWLARDRISICYATLMTIKNSLFRCSQCLDDYVKVAVDVK